MVLRQILAVVDFSVPGIHAAWRAARLAWSHGAELRLITLVEPLDSHPASRFGPGAPPVRAHADLSFLAEEIGAALDALSERRERPAGTIRISAENRRRGTSDDRRMARGEAYGHGVVRIVGLVVLGPGRCSYRGLLRIS